MVSPSALLRRPTTCLALASATSCNNSCNLSFSPLDSHFLGHRRRLIGVSVVGMDSYALQLGSFVFLVYAVPSSPQFFRPHPCPCFSPSRVFPARVCFPPVSLVAAPAFAPVSFKPIDDTPMITSLSPCSKLSCPRFHVASVSLTCSM